MRGIAAILLFAGLAGAQPGNPGADALVNEATAAARDGDYKQAEFLFRDLQANYPKDQRWYSSLTSVLEEEGRLQDALRLAQEGPGFPRNSIYYNQVGRLLLRMGRADDAMTALQSALRVADPASMAGVTYSYLGDAYRSKGDLDSAIGSYRKAKALLGVPGLFSLAYAFSEKGDSAEAVAEYRGVLRQQPNNATALNNLAYELSLRGESLDEALGAVQLALEVVPHSAEFEDTLGWVYFKLGRLAEAEDSMLEATAEEGGIQETLRDHMAAVMDARADWSGDRRELRKLLEDGESPTEVLRMKALLKELRGK